MRSIRIDCFPADEFAGQNGLAHLVFKVVRLAESPTEEIFRAIVEKRTDFDWFFENEVTVKSEQFPFSINDAQSISEAVTEFYEKAYPSEEGEVEALTRHEDQVYAYRERHSFRFGFRGQDVLNAHFGRNKSAFEISSDDDDHRYRYLINIEGFYEQLYLARAKYDQLFPE